MEGQNRKSHGFPWKIIHYGKCSMFFSRESWGFTFSSRLWDSKEPSFLLFRSLSVWSMVLSISLDLRAFLRNVLEMFHDVSSDMGNVSVVGFHSCQMKVMVSYCKTMCNTTEAKGRDCELHRLRIFHCHGVFPWGLENAAQDGRVISWSMIPSSYTYYSLVS